MQPQDQPGPPQEPPQQPPQEPPTQPPVEPQQAQVTPQNTATVSVDLSKVDTSFGGDNEPRDDKLIELLKQAYSGKIECRKAIVPIDLIKPFSDFKPKIDQAYRDYFAQATSQQRPPELYVYQEGDKFIMSDDYQAYYMYKEANSTSALCTVIGPSILTEGIEYSPPFRLPLPTAEEL